PEEAAGGGTPLVNALLRIVTSPEGREADAIVVLSDGRTTDSAVVPSTLSVTGIPVHSVLCAPLERSPDVQVLRIVHPSSALMGERVRARVVLRQRNATGRSVAVHLSDGRVSVSQSVTLDAPEVSLDLEAPPATSERLTLTATVTT